MARRRRVNRRKKSTKRRPCLGPIRVRSFKRKCPVRRGVSGGKINWKRVGRVSKGLLKGAVKGAAGIALDGLSGMGMWDNLKRAGKAAAQNAAAAAKEQAKAAVMAKLRELSGGCCGRSQNIDRLSGRNFLSGSGYLPAGY